MAYFHIAHRPASPFDLIYHQFPFFKNDNVSIYLPVLQAPTLSSIFNFFEEEKQGYSTVAIPDQHRTSTEQYLTTQLLAYERSQRYPTQQFTRLPIRYGRHVDPRYLSYMYYNR
jgi:hypothetical protein